ncbi:DUF6216 family protein [Luteibacter yeojuensis]|uniref:Uncharacterized protein n=1 Tax=Luteibacter yeojuensis TaxID=345309 RepID=A0A0F3KJY9_9GAMM|nr:DUF6216 family protein [Luteibacter yeojuensis]KJV31297.1 hypothetical protein VI08_13655 [Luteibacter yeojuensis]
MFDLLTANGDTLLKFVNAAWIASLVIWLCLRARSSHVLVSRIWRAMQGKHRSGDPLVARGLERRNALVQFRVRRGVHQV